GLLLSDNAPPLDMVLLERERPFRLPWLVERLGPGHLSLLLADLGAEREFPHARLFGTWIGFRPAERLEVGAGYVVQDGGEGAPEQGFSRRVAEYLLLVDLFAPDSESRSTNKIAGMDFRLLLPAVGAMLYGEMHVDDFRA